MNVNSKTCVFDFCLSMLSLSLVLFRYLAFINSYKIESHALFACETRRRLRHKLSQCVLGPMRKKKLYKKEISVKY